MTPTPSRPIKPGSLNINASGYSSGESSQSRSQIPEVSEYSTDPPNYGQTSQPIAESNSIMDPALTDGFSELLEDDETSSDFQRSFRSPQKVSRWRRWSLRRKATALALAIGVIPSAAFGGIAYTIASRSIRTELIAEQESRLLAIKGDVSVVINRFVDDANAIAFSPLFTDPLLSTQVAPGQKAALLNNLMTARNGRYDYIGVFTPEGRLLLQTDPAQALYSPESYRDGEHFQSVILSQAPTISNPRLGLSSAESYLEVAAPIMQSGTDALIGIVVIQMSSEHFSEVLGNVQASAWEFQLINAAGQTFAATDSDLIGQPMDADLQGLSGVLANATWADVLKQELPLTDEVIDRNDQEEVLVSLTSINDISGIPDPGWGLTVSRPTQQAFAPLHKLRRILVIGLGSAAILVGAISAILASRASRPLVAATQAVEKLSQGEWNVRLGIQGNDELAILCSTINNMAEQLEAFVEQRDLLHRRALELLLEVDPVRKGDLTIRANVTDDEVGTIADSYNSIIENLRRLVLQVKTATNRVEATASQSENLVQGLADGAIRQSEKIMATTQRIQTMSDSIHEVAVKAEVAEAAVQQATHAVHTGNELMDSTVDGIRAIRETVAETSKKVKHLGESSQKISTVVNLIKNFTEQTNVLALNASIEATRAGERGRGFAIVAEEVQELAQQSAKATTEIEKLVLSIQRATSEVVAAMEAGTAQVVTGTQLVNQTQSGLEQIFAANSQVNQVVAAIAQSAVEQARNSKIVTQTMAEVATITESTVSSTADVSESFKELLTVAKALQGSVSKFKVR